MSGIPFGRYELLEPIGAGGMAEVWRARLLGANRFAKTVVVKRILPHLSRNAEFSEMFTAEALLLARLDHPNVVQVIELSSVGDELFIAMEFLDGIDGLGLVQRLLPHGPLPIGLALYLVREVARALAYAHALVDEEGRPLGLIHRDVSPSNVMVLFDGRIKLLDFGIAKAVDRTDRETRTGVLKGKLGYMSPEAVSAEDGVTIDHRTDVFSCGAVLHELLCGRRLFKGAHDFHTMELIRRCEVPPPSSVRSDVSAALDAIVMRALARERDQRYGSAAELVAALSEALRATPWDADATARLLRERGIVAAERSDSSNPTVSAKALRGRSVEPATRRWPWLAVAGALALGGVAVWLRAPHPRTAERATGTPGEPSVRAIADLASPSPAVTAAPNPPAATSRLPPAATPQGPPARHPPPVKPPAHKGPRLHVRGKEGHRVDVLGGDVFDDTDR